MIRVMCTDTTPTYGLWMNCERIKGLVYVIFVSACSPRVKLSSYLFVSFVQNLALQSTRTVGLGLGSSSKLYEVLFTRSSPSSIWELSRAGVGLVLARESLPRVWVRRIWIGFKLDPNPNQQNKKIKFKFGFRSESLLPYQIRGSLWYCNTRITKP